MTAVWPAVVILAMLAHERPRVYRDDPVRVGVVALAIWRAQEELLPRWKRDSRYLAPALVVAAIQEGGLAEDVQSGQRRGAAGEVCLAQISPVNTLWRPYAEAHEDLAGLGFESTLACFETSASTLAYYEGRCSARGYRRSWLASMWTGYQFGGRCRPSDTGKARAKMTSRLANARWSMEPEYVGVLIQAEYLVRLESAH